MDWSRCQGCLRPILEGSEVICAVCEQFTSGLAPTEPAFQRESGRLIWRACRQLDLLQGSDAGALVTQLREAAVLLLEAASAVREGR